MFSKGSTLDNNFSIGLAEGGWRGDVQAEPEAMSTVSIDCVVFSMHQGRLKVLLVQYGQGPFAGRWALPGGWVREREDLDDSASRILKTLTGLDQIFLEQLRAFGDVGRVELRRIITIAFYALVNQEDYEIVFGNTTNDVQWRDLADVDSLVFDHEKILSHALESLRHKVRHEPIGFNLLPDKFTLLQLQELYEAILNIKLDKPNFRRKMMKMKLLVPCGEKQQHVAHRAAELYRFDVEVYERLRRQGFTFEV